jgi:hypothetical protein
MRPGAKKTQTDEVDDTNQPPHDFEVPYPDTEQDANMDLDISSERHLIFKTKINSHEDIIRFQTSVCDLLKIANPLCGVFGTSTYMFLRLNIMRRLLRQVDGVKNEEDGDTLNIYPAQGTVITFTPDNELSFFKIYPLFPSSHPGTSLVGMKRPR